MSETRVNIQRENSNKNGNAKSASDISDFVNSSQSTISTITIHDTDSQKSIISLSTTVTRSDSQRSLLSLSTETSEEDLFCNISSTSSESDTNTTTSKTVSTSVSELNDFTEFQPSTIRYCQGLTVLTGNKNKATSTVTDIQIFLTDGNDQRLLSESGLMKPVYALCKAKKIIALLVDNIEAGQYIVTFSGDKAKAIPETINSDDKSIKGLIVKKASVAKFTGSVTSSSLIDTQILILGSFHKQPLMRKMISTNQSLAIKVALLEDEILQTLQDQNSPVKHDQILLQIMNNAIKQMFIAEKKKNKMSKVQRKNNDTGEEQGEAVRKKPKFQLRIVLFDKPEKRKKKSKTDVRKMVNCSSNEYLAKQAIVDRD